MRCALVEKKMFLSLFLMSYSTGHSFDSIAKANNFKPVIHFVGKIRFYFKIFFLGDAPFWPAFVSTSGVFFILTLAFREL